MVRNPRAWILKWNEGEADQPCVRESDGSTWALRWHRRRHRRGTDPTRSRSDRAATLVEGALVAPLFLLIIFGVFEFGLLFRSYLTLSSGVRAAARAASTAGSDANADFLILQSITNNTRALKTSQIQVIVIFKATSTTTPVPTACLTASVSTGSTPCNRYVSTDLARPIAQFGCLTGGPDTAWCPTARKDRLSDPPDYIGVYMKVQHKYATGVFGGTKTLTDTVIMRVEPARL